MGISCQWWESSANWDIKGANWENGAVKGGKLGKRCSERAQTGKKVM